MNRVSGGLAGVALALASACPAIAQTADSARGRPVLTAVYELDGPVWTPVLGGADRISLPVAFASSPLLGVARALEGERRYGDAWRAALSVTAGLALSIAVKRLVRRERPFRDVPGITAKTGYAGARRLDRFSFPSGHATMAAAIAVSLALDHPQWYVLAPAGAFAVAVGTSRVWLGVHFPGDVAAGWILGVAVAVAVHALREELTPDGWDGDSGPSPPGLRIGL